MERLSEVYYLYRPSGFDGGVKGPDTIDTNDGTPVGIVFKGGGHLRVPLHRHDLGEIGHLRSLKAETVSYSGDIEGLKEACRRDQRPVERVGVAV